MVTAQMNDDASAEARYNMVECQLKPGGIRDYRLTLQVGRIAREAFIPSEARDLAYADMQVPCHAGEATRLLPTPTSFARMAELADVQPDGVVLDIAGGSGYSAAVLAGLSSTVIALEDDEAMVEKAGAIWQQLDIDNAVGVCGPLQEGQAKQGPFDVILINGCASELPQALLDQLVDGGRLICVRPVDGTQKAHIYRRIGDSFSCKAAFDCAVPTLTAFDPAPGFEF